MTKFIGTIAQRSVYFSRSTGNFILVDDYQSHPCAPFPIRSPLPPAPLMEGRLSDIEKVWGRLIS